MTDTTDNWLGYARQDFQLDGIDCILAKPHEPAPGKPWLWRARFWGAWPAAEIQLLGKGFHLAYIDVADLFGSPKAVARFDRLYEYLTTTYGLSTTPALMGYSRGGLIVYNWAVQNPEKVSCVYADAPVLDVKSWPGGKGAGPGSPQAWEKCLEAYDMDEAQMLQWQGNPIDHVAKLVAANIPVIHVCGEVDQTVPVTENTLPFLAKYRQLGGECQYIPKPNVGHHPHSLEDPTPIVAFMLKHVK